MSALAQTRPLRVLRDQIKTCDNSETNRLFYSAFRLTRSRCIAFAESAINASLAVQPEAIAFKVSVRKQSESASWLSEAGLPGSDRV